MHPHLRFVAGGHDHDSQRDIVKFLERNGIEDVRIFRSLVDGEGVILIVLELDSNNDLVRLYSIESPIEKKYEGARIKETYNEYLERLLSSLDEMEGRGMISGGTVKKRIEDWKSERPFCVL